MRFVLHAGPHKTGTSYIQLRMTANRAWLRDQNWLYPTIGTLGVEGHHGIAAKPGTKILADWPSDMELCELAAQCQEERVNLVLSAEGFRAWDAERLEALADLLGFESIELVYVIRDPYDLFHSFWAEEVKQGYANSLQYRMMHSFIDPLNSLLLNPIVDLSRMRSGGINMNLIYYDALKPLNLDICDVLTNDIMGVGRLPNMGIRRANQTPVIEITELLRLLTFRKHGTKRLNGSRFRLKVLNLFSPHELDEMAAVIQVHGGNCYRGFRLSRDTLLYHTIREQCTKLENVRHLPPKGIDYLPDGPVTYQSMDIGEMMLVPEIAELVVSIETRIQDADRQ